MPPRPGAPSIPCCPLSCTTRMPCRSVIRALGEAIERMKWKQSQRQTVAFLTFCDAERFSKARVLGEGLLKPIRNKPQCASNGDERPNRENSGQLAVLQAIQTQPQPSQHNERGYEYTYNTLRLVIHFLRVAQKLISAI